MASGLDKGWYYDLSKQFNAEERRRQEQKQNPNQGQSNRIEGNKLPIDNPNSNFAKDLQNYGNNRPNYQPRSPIPPPGLAAGAAGGAAIGTGLAGVGAFGVAVVSGGFAGAALRAQIDLIRENQPELTGAEISELVRAYREGQRQPQFRGGYEIQRGRYPWRGGKTPGKSYTFRVAVDVYQSSGYQTYDKFRFLETAEFDIGASGNELFVGVAIEGVPGLSPPAAPTGVAAYYNVNGVATKNYPYNTHANFGVLDNVRVINTTRNDGTSQADDITQGGDQLPTLPPIILPITIDLTIPTPPPPTIRIRGATIKIPATGKWFDRSGSLDANPGTKYAPTVLPGGADLSGIGKKITDTGRKPTNQESDNLTTTTPTIKLPDLVQRSSTVTAKVTEAQRTAIKGEIKLGETTTTQTTTASKELTEKLTAIPPIITPTEKLGVMTPTTDTGTIKLDIPPLSDMTGLSGLSQIPVVKPEENKVGIPETSTSSGGCCAATTAKLDAIDDKLVPLGLQAADLALLTTINNKLGEQVTGGLSGWLGRFSKSLFLDRAMNVLSLMLTIHNAGMLSRNLLDSISYLIDSSLQVVKLKDEDDAELNLSGLVGGSIRGAVETYLGTKKTALLEDNWKKLSSIYTSAVNIYELSLSSMAGIAEGLQTIGQYTGKIGNALKKSGTILENSYEWMDENVQVKTGRFAAIQKVTDGLQAATEVTSNLSEVTEEIQETTENVKQIQDEFKGIKDKVKANETEKKTKETTGKTNSQAPTIDKSNLTKPEA